MGGECAVIWVSRGGRGALSDARLRRMMMKRELVLTVLDDEEGE